VVINDATFKAAILDNVTIGQAYGLFLLEHGFDPDARDPILFLNDTDSDETVGDLGYSWCGIDSVTIFGTC
jgi:hypothetical protein